MFFLSRRYNIALLGVRDDSTGRVLLNPGVTYFLKESDICYYASEEDEDFFEFSVEQPTSFHRDLWRASATLGLLSLRLAGIELLDTEVALGPEKRQNSVISLNSLKGDELLAEKETDLGVTADICNWQQDIKRGLQLLHYHAEQDSQVKPCVRLNVVPRLSEEPVPGNSRLPSRQQSEVELEVLVEKTSSLRREASERRVRTTHPPPRGIFQSLRRSISSDVTHHSREGHASRRKSVDHVLGIPETGY